MCVTTFLGSPLLLEIIDLNRLRLKYGLSGKLPLSCPSFAEYNTETKGTNTILIRDLLATIDKFTKQEEIYTPKQMERIELDLQKKLVNQTKKRLFGSVRKSRNQTGIK